MALGVLFAAWAGLMWGMVFVLPVWLAEYPPLMLSAGRFVAFGLVSVPIGWFARHELARLTRADWLEALQLAVTGSLLYYTLLATAIQRSGPPLPTVIIGTLPVVIAVTANVLAGGREGHLPWGRLVLPLGLILAGIACVNQVELQTLIEAGHSEAEQGRYLSGAWYALGALVCWTWYPLRNARWLRAHPDRNPRAWATAQGLATLVVALPTLGGLWWWMHGQGSDFPMPWGPRPLDFVLTMSAMGILSSWVGILCWNEASQRVPTAVLGQLIVFETLAALVYTYALQGVWPEPLTVLGVLLLLVGVGLGVRIPARPAAA